MSLALDYIIDHDMDIPELSNRDNVVRQFTKRLGDKLNVYDCQEQVLDDDKGNLSDKWVLGLEPDCVSLKSPFGAEMSIYPKAMRIWWFSDELCIGPYDWLCFKKSYFVERNRQIRKRTHDILLKIKNLFKCFNPSVFVAQGDNMGYDCLYDCLEVGETIDEAFKHDGYYEKIMVEEWESEGFRLMGEKDNFIEADYGKCVIFYQKLDEIV